MGHQGLNILTLIETKIEPLSLKFSSIGEKVQKQRVGEILDYSPLNCDKGNFSDITGETYTTFL